MKINKIEYFVKSPDGFPIEREKTHASPEEAWQAFETWKLRFERQGYYSTVKNGSRLEIPLTQLKAYCSLGNIRI